MAVGYYTDAFESAISPWTTLGPLALVISISLLQEGLADLNRHKSDDTTNNAHCVILRRSEDLDQEGGTREKSVFDGNDLNVNLGRAYNLGTFHAGLTTPSAGSSTPAVGPSCNVAFEQIKRMTIRQGHLVLIRNRDMVPADLILLASGSDNGNAYIETSSIDGETNLKLRISPHLPESRNESVSIMSDDKEESKLCLRETLEQATKRVTRFSFLALPHGKSALENPVNATEAYDDEAPLPSKASGLNLREKGKSMARLVKDGAKAGLGAAHDILIQTTDNIKSEGDESVFTEVRYVAALKSEPPNASVNTFSGSLTLPPIQPGGASIVVPLNADNILLRGAVLRNTEWAIGLSVFTGTDTKLVRNSFETPSKFSQLDKLMNQTVIFIVFIMVTCITYLATFATYTVEREFSHMW